jgi:hypothetical protein
MATTTNYSWTTPDDTALVKDGAAAIRSLGTAIDSTVFTNAGAAVTKATVDAKGDLIAGTADNTVARLAVGANDTVLTADSSTATGLKWATPAGGGSNWTLLNSGGTSLTGAATVTVSGISGADKIMIIVIGASGDSNPRAMRFRFNTDTGNNYVRTGYYIATSGSYQTNFMEGEGQTNSDAIPFGVMGGNNASVVNGYCLITGCNSSGVKVFTVAGAGDNGGSNGNQSRSTGGIYNSSSVISSISVNINSGNLDAGTVYVYTSA